MMFQYTLGVLLYGFTVSWGWNILDYHAIPDTDTRAAAEVNAFALKQALIEANSTTSLDRTVLVPEGYIFYMANMTMIGITDITITVAGTLRFSDDMALFARDNDTKRYPMLYFIDVDTISLNGPGVIDGQVGCMVPLYQLTIR